MVRAVDEQHAHALHRRAGELAVRHRLLDALVDRGPEALRDDAADDLVHELVADVPLERLEDDVAVAELAAAAGLLLVAGVGSRDSARIVSRYGTRGGCSSTSMPKRRLARSSATSTCIWLMPERISSPVCWSRRSRSVGVLLGQAPDGLRHLLLVALRLGVIAKLITGSGEAEVDRPFDATSLSSSRSPVCASFSLATAPMSPAPNSLAAVCSLPCSSSSEPIRSLPLDRALTSVESPPTEPSSDAEEVDPPANGSAIVLNTNAAVPAPSTGTGGAPFFAGEGTPSTIRSSSACVPRFFVATPQATG